MDIFTIGFIAYVISLIKSKSNAKESMNVSRGLMQSMIGEIIGIIFMIGLILTFVPPETIESVLGSVNLRGAPVILQWSEV